jgi:hypothetical protein
MEVSACRPSPYSRPPRRPFDGVFEEWELSNEQRDVLASKQIGDT